MSPSPLYAESLKALSHVRHAFFTREGGTSQGIYQSLNMVISRTDDPGCVQQNWARAASYMELSQENLVMPHLVHGSESMKIQQPFKMPEQSSRPKVDGLLTSVPRLGVGITSADCVPVLLASKNHPMVAAVHAGWRGALKGIIKNTIAHFIDEGIPESDIVAVIGPCIHQESYEVGEDVVNAMPSTLNISLETFFKEHNPAKKKFLFDLPGFVGHALITAGVTKIEQLPHNTYTDEKKFFSCRRSAHRGEKNFGAQLSAIYLTEN